jgi:hypothetical protein
MSKGLFWVGLPVLLASWVAGAEENFLSPQAPHEVTYAKRGSTPGEIVTINGYQFQVQRMPVIDHAGGRYAVTFLLALDATGQPWDHYTDLDVYHTSEPLNAELMVDGFPARVDLFEKWSPYLYNGGGWQFDQFRNNRYEVSVQVGSARLVFQHEWERFYDGEPVGAVPNAVPTARWWALEDDLTPIRTFDWWIDYIRIYRMP